MGRMNWDRVRREQAGSKSVEPTTREEPPSVLDRDEALQRQRDASKAKGAKGKAPTNKGKPQAKSGRSKTANAATSAKKNTGGPPGKDSKSKAQQSGSAKPGNTTTSAKKKNPGGSTPKSKDAHVVEVKPRRLQLEDSLLSVGKDGEKNRVFQLALVQNEDGVTTGVCVDYWTSYGPERNTFTLDTSLRVARAGGGPNRP